MRRTVLVAPVLTLALLACLAGPAAAVPKDLRVDSATCSGVSVSGAGLPAGEQLFLLVRDLAGGAVVGGQPTPVRTTASAARDTAQTNCAAAATKGSLASTGPATGSLELALGLLLLVGAVAVWWSRYRPRHARA
jgi:LPXTG-motif cell wall-anchored protein